MKSHRLFTRAAAIFVLACGVQAPAQTSSPKVGYMPKDSVANKEFRAINGGDFSLSKARGKVVVVDFFTTWCGHSKMQVPALKKLYSDSQTSDLSMVGLAVEESDSAVAQFVRDNQIAYPVSTVSDPVFAEFVSSRNVSVPQTLVVGRDGRVAAHFIGYNSDVANELSAVVARELAKH
jgi:thiol-disulfide isomerase/thioredoxin